MGKNLYLLGCLNKYLFVLLGDFLQASPKPFYKILQIGMNVSARLETLPSTEYWNKFPTTNIITNFSTQLTNLNFYEKIFS